MTATSPASDVKVAVLSPRLSLMPLSGLQTSKKMAKRLRSGFTTGSCAAAAAKAAALLLVHKNPSEKVEIPFPDGSRIDFKVHSAQLIGNNTARASIIKDAGDDPDVTNRAEICATVQLQLLKASENCVIIDQLQLCGGEGVGTVTKPGLAVEVGEPAINPVPRSMISLAVREAVPHGPLRVTIIVPRGKILAEKTLNHRLGIVGVAQLGAEGTLLQKLKQANTAREMYEHIRAANQTELVPRVCLKAKEYCEDVTGREVKVYLIDHKAQVIAHV